MGFAFLIVSIIYNYILRWRIMLFCIINGRIYWPLPLTIPLLNPFTYRYRDE